MKQTVYTYVDTLRSTLFDMATLYYFPLVNMFDLRMGLWMLNCHSCCAVMMDTGLIFGIVLMVLRVWVY